MLVNLTCKKGNERQTPFISGEQFTEAILYMENILVTGGAGSIGTEICKQLNKSNAKKIII